MSNTAEIADKLKEICGQEQVRTDADTASSHAVDGVVPSAVVFPKDTQQVAQVIKYAGRQGLAVVPRGSGTKMAAGYPPSRLDLVVCTSNLKRMTDVDSDNLTITVEAGVKFRDIQARLATEGGGCFLPLDPPFNADATIGGILAANSIGPKRLLYGTPRDLVLGVRFVAPNGEIIATGGKTVKNVSGYDISKLMIGSAGSLGILGEMTLRLLPLPERMETLILAFDNLETASTFVARVLKSQLLPAAVEVLNRHAFAALKPDGVDTGPEGYTVAIALEAFDEAVERMRQELLDWAQADGIKARDSMAEEDQRIFWFKLGNLQQRLARRFPAMVALKLNYQFSAWKHIISTAGAILSPKNIAHALVCHSGSGICHINLLLDESDAAASERALAAVTALMETARQAKGNLVVRAAPPNLKPNLPMWGKIPQDFAVMQRIKKKLDPAGIMSPGRFVGGL